MIFLIIKMKIFNIQFLTNGAFSLENFYLQFQRPLFSLVEDCLEGFERRGIGGGEGLQGFENNRAPGNDEDRQRRK